jgi:hypothetical protein
MLMRNHSRLDLPGNDAKAWRLQCQCLSTAWQAQATAISPIPTHTASGSKTDTAFFAIRVPGSAKTLAAVAQNS